MNFIIKNYDLGYNLCSLALDKCTKDKLIDMQLNTLYVNECSIILYPKNIVISQDIETIKKFENFNNFDVLEIWENGYVNRLYNDESNENYLFITGSCNSNCVMCPSPEAARKNNSKTNISNLIELVRHIPSDTRHLTITGGEPFLIGESIFSLIKFLKEKFKLTDFLFLTNARVFCMEKYVSQFVESIPHNSIVAIPLHGSYELLHDSITQAKGSFKQTMIGIKNLLNNNIRVEIRIVVNKLNVADFDNIAQLIIEQCKGIEYVSVIALEMTGNARKNIDNVWLPYRESFSLICNAIKDLIIHGVNVKLYNFPLCTVNKSYWTLCEKSISSNKVRFAEVCDDCKYKSSCGGVFAGTFDLEKNELEAIL